MQIPEKLVNFRVYRGASEYLGMSDVELPQFPAMTENVGGAGIAGEYESPVMGHFGSQTLKLKFRAATEAALQLLAPLRHVIDIHGSIQVQDPMLGTLTTKAVRVEVTGQVKGSSLGKLEPGKAMAGDVDIEVAKIIVELDGVQQLELDKFNMIFRVLGVDYLEKIRRDLGGV